MGQPVTHWQIVTPRPDELASFYSKLFGWKVDANNPLGYRMIATGDARGIDGGIWPAPPEAQGFVQLHIEVADLTQSVEKAKAMGAGVIVPPQTLPKGEKMAVMRDPSGIPFAMSQPAA
jgi:predicted enzyme related to lactoylglutathione lyase